MIKLNNISYKYKNGGVHLEVLKDFDCSVNRKDFVTFLGKSGCGKSTLINIIAGYLMPDSGMITVEDTRVKKPNKNCLVVNQENDLFDWLTVNENMSLVCNNRKRNAELLNLVGLKQFENNIPSQLSGGMKKKLSIARALSTNPIILLLDEPFASLDYFTKESLQIEIIKLLKKESMTTIMVTHDVDEAIFLSDKVFVLEDLPTKVKEIVDIPFAFPRDPKIKETDIFLKLRHKIRSSY